MDCIFGVGVGCYDDDDGVGIEEFELFEKCDFVYWFYVDVGEDDVLFFGFVVN